MQFGNPQPQTDAAAPQGPAIFDVTDADFEQKVLAASMEIPIIVDFWAPWCGPCKQLTPALEKAVNAAKGAVRLAKVNTDESQGIAQALRVQSIPTVYAFFQGRPVDGFQGAVPESQIKAFIDKLIALANANAPGAIDVAAVMKEAAQAMADKNFEIARDLYGQILLQDPNNAPAYVSLVRAMIAAGYLEDAQALIEDAPPEISKAAIFAEAKTAVEMATVKPNGASAELQAKLAADPNDHQARLDLAVAEFAAGNKEQAMDHLLDIIRKNRGWNEDAARLQLLKFFEALGPMDPLTLQGRRKLSSILFS